MICVQVISDTLQVVNLAAGETCQYISLIQQTDFTEQESALDTVTVFALVGAAASVYGLVFVFRTVLSQFGLRG